MSRLGAKVIIGSRNVEKSKKAAQEIQDETGREVIALALDLASFESVQKFAKEVLSIRCVMFEPTDIQQGTNIPERLLNKPYANEVTLTG